MTEAVVHDGYASAARKAIAKGDLIRAYDICLNAIDAGFGSTDLHHLQLLAMARMGDTETALSRFQDYGLALSPDPHHRALQARLLKDRALKSGSTENRAERLRHAADAYVAIYRQSGDYYPAINAASLLLLSGAGDAASTLASEILAMDTVASAADYYALATRAEALLIQGQVNDVVAALQQAVQAAPDDYGAHSSTRTQLLLLAAHLGLSDDLRNYVLAPLAVPKVAHYCGHMFRADPKTESHLKQQIAKLITIHNIGSGYGALAAGSDIAFAETLLEMGREVHIIFPFDKEDFIAQSIRPAGHDWLPRFEHCLEQASSVTFASEMNYVEDPAQFQYCTHVAMGMARLRARHLGSGAVQLAIWDEVESEGPAGTGADVAHWRKLGGQTIVLDGTSLNRTMNRPSAKPVPDYKRALTAIIFTDFKGFSKLKEAALPMFWDGVMRKVAEVLGENDEHILSRNSWGDALYAVIDDIGAAAKIAHAVQSRLADFDYTHLGISGGGGMRIGLHYGPVYQAQDLITGQINFYGTEVSRAARIEPVTPPGAVYVTEPFAAILALHPNSGFDCSYVGWVELAKGYGTYPMYRLNAIATQ